MKIALAWTNTHKKKQKEEYDEGESSVPGILFSSQRQQDTDRLKDTQQTLPRLVVWLWLTLWPKRRRRRRKKKLRSTTRLWPDINLKERGFFLILLLFSTSRRRRGETMRKGKESSFNESAYSGKAWRRTPAAVALLLLLLLLLHRGVVNTTTTVHTHTDRSRIILHYSYYALAQLLSTLFFLLLLQLDGSAFPLHFNERWMRSPTPSFP